MALGYLLDPFIQIQNDNGTPIVGAKIYVYNADTSNLATTYNDFEGHLNTNPIITDDLGNATIIADDGIEYDVSVHDENDLLLFTKKYVSIDKTSSAGGTTQVAPGYGVTVERVGNVFTVSVDTDLIATKEDLNDKQDKLTGGDNIEITNDNTVNVVNRKELVTQYPLRINRTNDRVKIYLDSDFSDEFKTKQTPVEYGGAVGNYISYIAQNENGEIEATVQETVLPSFDDIHAGDNISITRTGNDLTISSKDWTNDITSAVSGKLDTSTFNTYSAAHASDDVTPYSGGTGISVNNHTISCTGDITAYTAGSNINITNHVVSGKDWSSDISNAVSGKIDKVTGGAGSETNPVYLNSSNVITPCFSGSVKLANTIPNYFALDAGSNIMLYAPNGSHKASGDSIRNSVFITNYDNFLTNTTTDKFEDCIFMGNCYMYSPSNANTCLYSDNIIIGNNSISDAQNNSVGNTVIGSENDLIGSRGATSHKFYNNTFIGYQNNSYTDSRSTTVVGSNNDVGNYEETATNNKEVQVSIFGYNNEYKYDSTNSSPYDGLMVGNNNTIESKENYRAATIGFDNNLTGNCTYLIGDGLTATNEGSYSDKVMKIGFGSCHLEIHSTGIIYKVVNGTKTQI